MILCFYQVTHFYTKICNFPDDFMTWTKYTIFIRWIFCIFQVPYEKKGCTNQYSMLSLTRNNKKSKNRKKLTSAKILPRQQYRLQDCACKVLMLNWYNTDLRSCSHCFHVCIPHMRTRLCACHILGAFIFLASTIWSMWLSEPLRFCPRCVRECYTNVIQLLILLNSPLSSSA